MKKLALLGPARPSYPERFEKERKKHAGGCWSGWSYKITDTKLKILNEQIEKDGYFYIYVHDIEHPEDIDKYGTGTGYIDFKLRVEEFEYGKLRKPSSRYTPIIDTVNLQRLYVYITKKPEPVTPRKKFYEFLDFDTESPVPKKYLFFGESVRSKEFIYIVDD